MNSPNTELKLKITPRPSEKITLSIPSDTLALLKIVAAQKDMSLEGLLKFYIGQGLRGDRSQLHTDEKAR